MFTDALFTDVLSFGEIREGILPPSKKRDELEQWLAYDLHRWFGNNLLPVNQSIADRWGIFAARSKQQGKALGTIDGLIAATAFEHGLTVVSRNTRHFEDLGVQILDPWAPEQS